MRLCTPSLDPKLHHEHSTTGDFEYIQDDIGQYALKAAAYWQGIILYALAETSGSLSMEIRFIVEMLWSLPSLHSLNTVQMLYAKKMNDHQTR